jgi:hypothetical protein
MGLPRLIVASYQPRIVHAAVSPRIGVAPKCAVMRLAFCG